MEDQSNPIPVEQEELSGTMQYLFDLIEFSRTPEGQIVNFSSRSNLEILATLPSFQEFRARRQESRHISS